MPHFYKVDHRKITLREYWNLSPNWMGVVAWLMKVIGRPLANPNLNTQPLSSQEFEVPEDQLPAEHASAISDVRKQLDDGSAASEAANELIDELKSDLKPATKKDEVKP